MKCIVCDRCKKIIEDPKRYRVILCSRPLKPQLNGAKSCRSDDKQANDILWEKELCMSCADEIENFTDMMIDPPENPDDGSNTNPIDPDDPGQPDPTDPDTGDDGEHEESGNDAENNGE